MRREIHNHLDAVKRDGCAVLIATHDMEEAEQLCDRIAVIASGRIVATGTPRDLMARTHAAMQVAIETDAPLMPAWLGAAQNAICEGNRTRFTTGDLTRTLAELGPLLARQGIAVTALKAGRATLEDVILDLTGGR
jgi:ABC-2 type transport system ATP-binding protein